MAEAASAPTATTPLQKLRAFALPVGTVLAFLVFLLATFPFDTLARRIEIEVQRAGGDITIGEYAFFGHEVAVLTGTHDITEFGRQRQTTFPRSGRDVVIEEGVWVASHAMVLGPVRIGRHAVVAAGSLVLDDVAPYTVVAGRPAKVIKKIGEADQTTPADPR